MERNPELTHLLNNPQMLRESMQLAANPVIATALQSTYVWLQYAPWAAAPVLSTGVPPSWQGVYAFPVQALMREQMRNADRAMSNLESHPEGFNVLRRMYENIQVPSSLPPCATTVRRGLAAQDCLIT